MERSAWTFTPAFPRWINLQALSRKCACFGPTAKATSFRPTNFFSDEGISGTKASHPGLDRLMAAVENDEASSVVV